MQTARDRIAHQLGTLVLSNIEQAAHIEHLTEQLQASQQRLHDSAEPTKPSGATPAPDEGRGS
jgi:hypothetical protein